MLASQAFKLDSYLAFQKNECILVAVDVCISIFIRGEKITTCYESIVNNVPVKGMHRPVVENKMPNYNSTNRN